MERTCVQQSRLLRCARRLVVAGGRFAQLAAVLPCALVLVVALAAMAVGASNAFGQAPPHPEGTVRVVLTDGSAHVGIIEDETDDAVTVVTTSGVRMTIPRERIRRVEAVAGLRFYRMDPNRSRLIFAPTARSLSHGSGYVAVYELFFPFAAVGLWDVVSLSGGISLIPGAPEQVVYAAPKLTVYDRGNVQLALGTIAGTSTGRDGSAGIAFAVGTVGGPHSAITVAVGFGHAEGEFSRQPILLVAGEYQVSNSVKLLSENYVVPGYEDAIVVSGGVRFFGDRLAADVALFTAPALLDDWDGFPFIPWVGFAYNFGR